MSSVNLNSNNLTKKQKDFLLNGENLINQSKQNAALHGMNTDYLDKLEENLLWKIKLFYTYLTVV